MVRVITAERKLYMKDRNLTVTDEEFYCIYSKRNAQDATFTSQEHIIPKSIGGIYKLPLGWVCDEVNGIFSKCERNFVHENPLIAIPRMFFGPTGRKNHKKSGVSFAREDDGKIVLCYIENGFPIIVNQIVFNDIDKFKQKDFVIHMNPETLESLSEDTLYNVQNEFFHQISSYNGDFEVIRSKDCPKNNVFIGIVKKCVYIGVNEQFEKDITDIFSKIQNFMKHSSINRESLSVKKDSQQVKYGAAFSMNLIEIFRCYAKISFNCLAKLMGRRFVLDSQFDTIRNSILTGDNIDQYVVLNKPINDNAEGIFLSVIHRFNVDEDTHFIVLLKYGEKLCAHVFCYGFKNATTVLLSENCKEFPMLKIYCCDWKNKQEFELIDKITQSRSNIE